MGMFSEIAAYQTAKELEKVLQAAKDTNNKEVCDFCAKHVLPVYLSEICEAWVKANEDLVAYFKQDKK